MHTATVIDFPGKRKHRRSRSRSDALAELALDKCEETFRQRDWERFAHWHAVYLRERKWLGDAAGLSNAEVTSLV